MSAFNKYFQEELANLRELAKEFSERHPALAPYLSGPSTDPDVERLLEGVAFLTGLLRQKLDDEFPEIIHQLMDLIWPHYLRPIPCSSIVHFKPKPGVRGSIVVPEGTGVSSVSIEGTSCHFRTCYPLEVLPIKIIGAKYRERAGLPIEMILSLETYGINLSELNIESFCFFLADEYSLASDLYCVLFENVDQIKLCPKEGGDCLLLPKTSLKPGGMDEKESLLPYPSNSFPGYRIIQEYFLNPQKFLFFKITDLERWENKGEGTRFEIRFRIKKRPRDLPKISEKSFVLSAVPVINIFPAQGEPIRLDHKRYQYPIRISSENPNHYQLYSVKKVVGFIQGTAKEREYSPFSFFGSRKNKGPYYVIRKRPKVSGPGMDTLISFSYDSIDQMALEETISLELFCTNGFLPEEIQLGDISRPTSNTPELLEFKNLTPVSPCLLPAIGRNLLWRFISHLNLNYSTLKDADSLKALLNLYIFKEGRDKKLSVINERRVAGIENVDCHLKDRIVSGLVLRGIEMNVTIRSDHFASKGDMYLFGTVLDNFFGCYAALNSFTTLIFKDSLSGEEFRWKPRIGQRQLL